METLLRVVLGVVVYLDDILISSTTEASRTSPGIGRSPETVSYSWKKRRVEFLGHLVNEKEISPLPEKIQVIKQAPRPATLTELKSYLGLLSYHGKFLPHSIFICLITDSP